jgi:hypothetical protein
MASIISMLATPPQTWGEVSFLIRFTGNTTGTPPQIWGSLAELSIAQVKAGNTTLVFLLPLLLQ